LLQLQLLGPQLQNDIKLVSGSRGKHCPDAQRKILLLLVTVAILRLVAATLQQPPPLQLLVSQM